LIYAFKVLLHALPEFGSYMISEVLKFESITAESLRAEKGFQKTARKQQKELDAMKKRQLKEQLTMQKQQCTAIEKLIKGKKYVTTNYDKF
jgi:phosphatidylinositol phospholipase C beta